MFTQIGREIVFSADLCYNESGDENGYRKRISTKKKIAVKRF